MPVLNADSTFTGYVEAGEGLALLVSEGRPNDVLSPIRFLPLGDSLLLNDTLRSFSVDSMAFRVGLLARDSAVSGLEMLLYRIPSDVDSTVTYQDLVPFIDDSTLIGSIDVADSVISEVFRLVVSDSATLDLLSFVPDDSTTMAIVVAMRASQGSGIRIGSLAAGGSGPLFQSFVTLDSVADTTMNRQVISRIAQFNTFVFEAPTTVDDTLLTIGGAPSARSLLRYALPSFLQSRDSAQIIRATLELFPVGPIQGLRNDSSLVRVRGVQSDLGAKSPLCQTAVGTFCGSWFLSRAVTTGLTVGSSDTVSVEVGDLVRGWQGELGSEQALFLELLPEAASFTIPVFGSTRTPGSAPRLLITYSLPFPFEQQ